MKVSINLSIYQSIYLSIYLSLKAALWQPLMRPFAYILIKGEEETHKSLFEALHTLNWQLLAQMTVSCYSSQKLLAWITQQQLVSFSQTKVQMTRHNCKTLSSSVYLICVHSVCGNASECVWALYWLDASWLSLLSEKSRQGWTQSWQCRLQPACRHAHAHQPREMGKCGSER